MCEIDLLCLLFIKTLHEINHQKPTMKNLKRRITLNSRIKITSNEFIGEEDKKKK